eukprot:CAMPEP_0172554578 /NCGR_PEP_ID=MMETSP1067-20121228/55320_1 /TAXON_ID=265564 ORGANISM="Thalassiosira punctigera, Strain Tpunct2005C2" /NCGR_SAMPLE_ID=MMETSP1067 /ASSEMBLY_ACC=CAM_ASM_000444 /LENGTH=668 /DNA_ID=CAMNT_0013342973 /DNA_START=136 /DNA_END=2142 /DNA_ORIENTATION=+
MLSTVLFFVAIICSAHGVRRLPHDEHAPPVPVGRRLSNDDDRRDVSSLPRSPRRAAGSDPDPDSHLVTSLPLLPDGAFPTRHWAGHLPAADDGSDKKIFYWLFEPGEGADNMPGEVPLILWINGGPGCSSMDGLWLENGPFRLKPGAGGWTIDVNPHSWHNAAAWTMYVDQPVGTGLSFTKKKRYCKNDFEVNRDFHYFLEEFFLFHRDKFLSPTAPTDKSPAAWTVKRPFYFTGESHAGHYIPSMMDFILQRNDGKVNPSGSNGLKPLRVVIPCSGAAIGNGWVDPFHQYAASDAAYGAGLIGTSQRASFQEKERVCQSKLKSGNYRDNVCFALLDDIVDQSGGKSGNSKVSQYDTRFWEKRGAARTFPQGHKDVETYLGGARSSSNPPLKVNNRDVLAAIHATEATAAGLTYQECTDPPYLALQHQDGLGVVQELIRVLDHESKPHMLFFNGIHDLICNHVGNEQLLDALPWSKTSQYTQQPRHAWESGVDTSLKFNYIAGRPDGYIKQFDNLSFLKILEAGHMVPMDQPAVALAMIHTLVYGTGKSKTGFLSSEQNLARAVSNKDEKMCKLDECPNCIPPEPVGEEPAGQGLYLDTDTAPLMTLSNFGILLAAFTSGIILSCLCQRRQQRESAKRVLASLDDDMELTDQDSIYRDTIDAEDGEYT